MGQEFHFIIQGDVQGVGFRSTTRHYARKLGLKGYVENLRDGSVKICIQGEEKEAKKLIDLLKQEFPSGTIQSITLNKVPIKESLDSFDIKISFF